MVFKHSRYAKWLLDSHEAKTLQKLSEIVNCEMQQWWANVYEDRTNGRIS